MSVTEVIEKLSTGASAAPEVPVTSPVTTDEPTEPVVPAEEQPTGDTPAEQPTEVPEEPVEETEPNLEEQPESSGDFAKYKPLFKENPELRNILGREKAFSELGEFSTVREVMSRVPTVEDAEVLVADAETKRVFSETFRDDPETFVESLRDSDSLAFQNLAQRLPEILAQTDERLWKEQATTYTSTVLNNAFSIARNSGDNELVQAIQLISNALGMPLGAQQPTRPVANPELEKLRREKQEREKSDAQAAFDSFWGQTDAAIIESTVNEIDSTLKKAVPTATPAQLERMKREVYDKTLANLNAQPQFTSQLATYRQNAEKGRMGIGDHKQIVDFAVRRAKLVIPKAAKEIVNEWSTAILKQNTAEIEKKKAIAKATKDPGKGPQGGSATTAPTAKPGAGRHLKDVFKEIENRITGR